MYSPARKLKLEVRDQTGETIFVNCTDRTRLYKVFSMVARLRNQPEHSLRFHLDGERLSNETCLQDYDLEEEDYAGPLQIDIFQAQIGGWLY